MMEMLLDLTDFLVCYIVVATIVNMVMMGMLCIRFSHASIRECYLITADNRIDIQAGVRCAGFASAFVLRHFGIDVSGNELYNAMPSKKPDGTVYPKGIQRLLAQHGFKVKYCAGNLNALKNALCKGDPVIAFIHVRPNKKELHFVPVVGFDADHIYLAESLQELANCREQLYNRKVSSEEFKRLWNTIGLKMPLYKNTYLTVSRKKQ